MNDLPVWLATIIAMILFASIGIACWAMGRERAFMDAPDRSRWRDLRFWATVVVLVQFGIYYALQ